MNFTETYKLKFYCSICWKHLNGTKQHEFIKDYSNLTGLQFSYQCECGNNSFNIIGIDRNREFKDEETKNDKNKM